MNESAWISKRLPLAFFIALSITNSQAADPVITPSPAPDLSYEKTVTRKVLGTDFGGSQFIGVDPSTRRVEAKAGARVLGRNVNYLQASVEQPSPQSPPSADFYAFGKRVWSHTSSSQPNAALGIAIAIPPVEYRVTGVSYPVGPLMLQADGGARAQARLSVQSVPNLFVPEVPQSEQLHADATITGFVEGYAKLLVIRAGIGGELDLVDGSSDLSSQFASNSAPPQVQFNAHAKFLDGRLFAFADYFYVFRWKWARFLDRTLFNWNGFCFATAGDRACGAH